jgi:hypothetical protein
METLLEQLSKEDKDPRDQFESFMKDALNAKKPLTKEFKKTPLSFFKT